MNTTKVGLYIHIPFCSSKCPYCDFYSIVVDDETVKNHYLSSLRKEIEIYSNKITGVMIQSIFVGGGTPTTLSGQQIAEILKGCYQHFKIKESIEITVESNPATFDRNKAKALFHAGVNRISIGAQSFNNRLLKKIGRIHNKQDILDSFFIARQAGFRNINLDMMIGLPGQTMKSVDDSLNEIVRLCPEHISLYSLSIEEGTPFERLKRSGKLRIPNDDQTYEMYRKSIDFLHHYGYEQYEISNFALPYKRCFHNQIYWKNQPYLGLGASATSYIDDRRIKNYSDVKKYIELLDHDILPIESKEILPLKEKMAETIILQLRMMDGLSRSDFLRRFHQPVEALFSNQLDHLMKQGLLDVNDTHYFLTKKGIPLANIVFIEFLD